MYTVIRTYTGMPGVATQLTAREKEIESVIRSAPGFIAYYLLDTPDGMTSVTVCENRAGCEETSRLAANWLRDNLPQLAKTPPQITYGDLAMRFYAQQHVRT